MTYKQIQTHSIIYLFRHLLWITNQKINIFPWKRQKKNRKKNLKTLKKYTKKLKNQKEREREHLKFLKDPIIRNEIKRFITRQIWYSEFKKKMMKFNDDNNWQFKTGFKSEKNKQFDSIDSNLISVVLFDSLPFSFFIIQWLLYITSQFHYCFSICISILRFMVICQRSHFNNELNLSNDFERLIRVLATENIWGTIWKDLCCICILTISNQ